MTDAPDETRRAWIGQRADGCEADRAQLESQLITATNVLQQIAEESVDLEDAQTMATVAIDTSTQERYVLPRQLLRHRSTTEDPT